MLIRSVIYWEVQWPGGLPEEEACSVNNLSGIPNKDGSFTIHFGGDPKIVNHLPISEGWNYMIRFYLPRKEILDGSWTFQGGMPKDAK
ncbi:hypothetical protein [Oceanispirochaeta sp. M2]|nr:hypothetical protein [Oceanispirochaeta sp. M2]MBF9017262.1 hypothetical protein [Oceanispirochaeta sp. M2]NPD75373.1 hypothetical protein [Oceanispirochaeta sp. M1]RDG28776.1 hypothetical protein DV872_25080 [Oceanispirochaeta sp. M1]